MSIRAVCSRLPWGKRQQGCRSPRWGVGKKNTADMLRYLRGFGGCQRGLGFGVGHFSAGENFVDEAVGDGVFGGHVVVAIRVVFDLLDSLAGVMGEDAVEAFFQVEHEADGAFDVGGGAAGATGDLVNHHVGVRQAEAFAFGACGEQHGTHRGANADAIGVHIAGHELHGVIDRQTCGDGATGGVDVDVNVFFRVLHLKEQKLGDDRISDVVIDAGADENDPVLEQTGVDIERALAAAVGLDDYGDIVTIFRGDGLGK